jgi:pilus assembly protein CpaD
VAPFKSTSNALLVLAAAAAALGGCASGGGPAKRVPAIPASNAFEQYKADVVEVPDQIALGIHPQGLSQRQVESLGDFAARWRDSGSGDVVVEQPDDAKDAAAARAMVFAVEGFLHAHGVPGSNLKIGAYTAGGPDGPILARFKKTSAKVADCTQGWDNLSSTMDNEVYHHFGCALVANMAAQLADPRDLVTPTPLAPGDAARRQFVLDRYRQGKSSTTEKDKQADGSVSAVQQ